jgi:hypothetical protein
MNSTLNNKNITIIIIYNIIIYLGSFLLAGPFAVSLWYHMLPWTFITLFLISITNVILYSKNISIKLNIPLILLFLGLQILALMSFVYTPTTTFFSYHFIMLISLIPGGLAYYVGYRSRTIIDNTEARKNYIPYILPLIILAIVSIIAVAWYFYSGWINSPADIPQEYNENNVTPEYQDSTPPLDTNF